MTDVAPDTGTDATTQDTTSDTDTVDWKAEAEKYQALQRKWEDRAKVNANAAKELEQVKASSMTEQERAVAEAVAAARQQTLSEVGGRLAAAEIRVAAAGRLDDHQLDTILDTVNLAKFLDEDGEVDQAKVASFVDGIAPAPAPEQDDLLAQFQSVDLGQGARGKDLPLNGDPLLNAVRDRLNIKR